MSSPPLLRPRGRPRKPIPARGVGYPVRGLWSLQTAALIFRIPKVLGATLRPPIQGPVPTIPPAPRRHPSTRNSFLFPFAFWSGCCRVNLSGQSRRQNLIPLPHLHRCQLELALCKGLGSLGSYQTELRRVGALFSFLFHFC